MNGNGDCYQANGRLFSGLNDSSFKICHGMVIGQGPIAGLKLGHAWLENKSRVLDFSNDRQLSIPKKQYYKIGRITNVKRYNQQQFNKMLLKHKHWGPF